VAPVKALIASHRLVSAAGASIGILLEGRLLSSSSGGDNDDATRVGMVDRPVRSDSERTFIVHGEMKEKGEGGKLENPKIRW